MKELIQLQNANMHQTTNSAGVKSDWLVRANITSETLYVLPSSISDRDMFAVIDMSKQYELTAFNTGIDYGKKLANDVLSVEINYLKEKLLECAKHSNMLAKQLEK